MAERQIPDDPSLTSPRSKDNADIDPVEPDTELETAKKLAQKFEEALARLPPG